MATTEPQKLPATILSRCQRFDFKRISNEDIIKRLKIVCKESNIEIADGALNIIAVLSEGAMRDALSILERCIQDGENKIDEDKIRDLVGIPKMSFVHSITKGIIEYDIEKALESINSISEEGKDLNNFIWEIIKYVKDILIYKTSGKAELYSEEDIDNLKMLSEKASKDKLVDIIYQLSQLETDMKYSTQKSIMFQAGIIKLCSKEMNNKENFEERLNKIENYIKSGKSVSVVDNNRIQSTVNNYVKNNIEEKPVNKQPIIDLKDKKYSNDLNKSWPKIISDLKQSGKIVLYTNLMNTKAEEINDMTVGIKFPRGLTAFGKTVLEKQENIKEISTLVSMACGKEMQIKYIAEMKNQAVEYKPEDDIQKLANQSDIPFKIIE